MQTLIEHFKNAFAKQQSVVFIIKAAWNAGFFAKTESVFFEAAQSRSSYLILTPVGYNNFTQLERIATIDATGQTLHLPTNTIKVEAQVPESPIPAITIALKKFNLKDPLIIVLAPTPEIAKELKLPYFPCPDDETIATVLTTYMTLKAHDEEKKFHEKVQESAAAYSAFTGPTALTEWYRLTSKLKTDPSPEDLESHRCVALRCYNIRHIINNHHLSSFHHRRSS